MRHKGRHVDRPLQRSEKRGGEPTRLVRAGLRVTPGAIYG
jgi:hypothetical protein